VWASAKKIIDEAPAGRVHECTHWYRQMWCNGAPWASNRTEQNSGQLDGLLSHWQPAFANKLID